MNWFSRPPNQPYRNLFFAAFIGVPVGCLMASLHKALFDATSLQQALKFIAFALPTSVSGYLVMVPLLGAYGLPALWLALKVRRAGPATAFAVSVLPGLKSWPALSQEGAPHSNSVPQRLAPAALPSATRARDDYRRLAGSRAGGWNLR